MREDERFASEYAERHGDSPEVEAHYLAGFLACKEEVFKMIHWLGYEGPNSYHRIDPESLMAMIDELFKENTSSAFSYRTPIEKVLERYSWTYRDDYG